VGRVRCRLVPAASKTARRTPPKATPKTPRKTASKKKPRPTPGYGDEGKTSTTTSTFSPRLLALKSELDGHLRRRFPRVEPVFAYGMHGWRMKRPHPVDWTVGTIDPAYVHVFVAERKQGITLHLWNPYEPNLLGRNAKDLAASGFKVMVGCLQFNRKSKYPLGALLPLLDTLAAAMEREA
jgi:hypothetical protein